MQKIIGIFVLVFLALAPSFGNALTCSVPTYVDNSSPFDYNVLELFPDVDGQFFLWQEVLKDDAVLGDNAKLILHDIGVDFILDTSDDQQWVITDHSKYEFAHISNGRVVFLTDNLVLQSCIVQPGGCIPQSGQQGFNTISSAGNIREMDLKDDLLVFNQELSPTNDEIVVVDLATGGYKKIQISRPLQNSDTVVQSSGKIAVWLQVDSDPISQASNSSIYIYNPTSDKLTKIPQKNNEKMSLWSASSYNQNMSIIYASDNRFNKIVFDQSNDTFQPSYDSTAPFGIKLNKSVSLGYAPFERSLGFINNPMGLMVYDLVMLSKIAVQPAKSNILIPNMAKGDGKNVLFVETFFDLSLFPDPIHRVKHSTCN